MEDEIEEFVGMDHPIMKDKTGFDSAFVIKYPTDEEFKEALEDVIKRFAGAFDYLKDR